MQYEYPHFRIDQSDWIRGSNTFENYPDGGIKTSYAGYNVFSKPGWLANAQSYGDIITSSLPTKIGISFGYGKGSLVQEVVAVGSNGSDDGSFYTVNSTTGALTKVGSDDTGRDYVLGKTSTIFYDSKFYTTSSTDITENTVDLATRDTSWWVTTKGQTSLNSLCGHPQVVYGDIHYIADGQYIHQNDHGTVQAQVFDLGAEWVITEMCVYNNLIHIAAEPYYNFSGTNHGFAKIFTWNGYAESWIDEWLVDHRINAMYVFKNVLYCWTPKFMAYWTGSTLKNLYPVSTKVHKDQIITTEDSMWFGDATFLIRYGSPYPTGALRFYRYTFFGSNINGIAMPAAEMVLVCTTGVSNGGNYKFLTTDAPSGNLSYGFNRRIFSRPVRVRGYVIHADTIASGKYVAVSYLDDTGTLRATKTFTGTVSAMVGKTRWRFDVLGQPPTTYLDPYVTLAGAAYVRAIDVLYEPSDDKLNA